MIKQSWLWGNNDVRVHRDGVLADVSNDELIVWIDRDASAISEKSFPESVNTLALMRPYVDLLLATHSYVIILQYSKAGRLAQTVVDLGEKIPLLQHKSSKNIQLLKDVKLENYEFK